MTGGAQATWIASSQHCEIKEMMPFDTSWSGFQYLNLGNIFLIMSCAIGCHYCKFIFQVSQMAFVKIHHGKYYPP